MLGSGRNYGTGTTNQGPSGIETASMDPVSINFKSTEARTRMQRVSWAIDPHQLWITIFILRHRKSQTRITLKNSNKVTTLATKNTLTICRLIIQILAHSISNGLRIDLTKTLLHKRLKNVWRHVLEGNKVMRKEECKATIERCQDGNKKRELIKKTDKSLPNITSTA